MITIEEQKALIKEQKRLADNIEQYLNDEAGLILSDDDWRTIQNALLSEMTLLQLDVERRERGKDE